MRRVLRGLPLNPQAGAIHKFIRGNVISSIYIDIDVGVRCAGIHNDFKVHSCHGGKSNLSSDSGLDIYGVLFGGGGLRR